MLQGFARAPPIFSRISATPVRALWASATRTVTRPCKQCTLAARLTGRSFSRTAPRRTSSGGGELNNKPYYITTPIFYVNASPHIGHLYTMVLTDVLKRWEVLKGERAAYLCTGTDEHGMKIQQAASREDVPPKVFCDANAEIFKDLAKKANVSNDCFIRTTDPNHREAVEYFWAQLRDRGFIYETTHAGWYCVSDETFYPESMVTKEVSHLTGKPFFASTETGNAVEWTEEKNYHFRMTDLKDRLLEFYRDNPEWVLPASRMAGVVDWVEKHLEDLSVSRPVSRLDWGIRVPDDPSQTIYVWVDALINYLTSAGYPVWPPGAEHSRGWPADVQVIGKDIVRFHCVYWPALLMALDLPLPKRILSHGHWLMNKRKMSKSSGNVVNPFFALERWGVDALRFFLVHGGGISSDAEYSNELMVTKYKKGLQDGLGNLLNRVTRSKNWSVRESVMQVHEHGLPTPGTEADMVELVAGLAGTVATLRQDVTRHMEQLHAGNGLKTIMEHIHEANRIFELAQPWKRSKAGQMRELYQGVYLASESLRIAGILLQPFMPQKAGEVLDRIGVKPDRRTMGDASLNVDDTYGEPLIELGTGALSSLFPPLPVED